MPGDRASHRAFAPLNHAAFQVATSRSGLSPGRALSRRQRRANRPHRLYVGALFAAGAGPPNQRKPNDRKFGAREVKVDRDKPSGLTLGQQSGVDRIEAVQAILLLRSDL